MRDLQFDPSWKAYENERYERKMRELRAERPGYRLEQGIKAIFSVAMIFVFVWLVSFIFGLFA